MQFQGKVVIVTGSSSGIGKEAAFLFATQGASVTIHGQNEERLKQTVDYLKENKVPDSRIHVVRGAIEEENTQRTLIDETVGKFGGLDVLTLVAVCEKRQAYAAIGDKTCLKVNNAGLTRRHDLDSNSLNNFEGESRLRAVGKLKEVGERERNASTCSDGGFSVVALTRLAVPHLTKRKGNVVNVSSVASRRASPFAQPYVISKAALDHYTRNAAVTYASQSVRVNNVSPGITATNFAARHRGDQQGSSGTNTEQMTQSLVPMKRQGTAREVAHVIEFLASDRASYITGTDIVVDGGLFAGAPPPEKKA